MVDTFLDRFLALGVMLTCFLLDENRFIRCIRTCWVYSIGLNKEVWFQVMYMERKYR